MPPKIKITKKIIIDAGIEIVRSRGFEAVNAREISKIAGCSTQPIFRIFSDMSELKRALWERAWEEYALFLENACRLDKTMKETRSRGLTMGVAYVKFAMKEKHLYKLIFLSNSIEFHNLHDLVYNIDNSHGIIEIFMEMCGLDRDKSYDLHFREWMFMHGIATIVSTNNGELSDNDIERLIKENLKANCDFLKNN